MAAINPEIKYKKHFIAGKWVDSVDGKKMAVINPSDGEKFTEVAEGGPADINAAVAAAKKAFRLGSEWRTMDASQRGRILTKVADFIERDVDYIVSVEVMDNGKPASSAYEDVLGAAGVFRYFAGYADKIHGKTIPSDGKVFAYTREEPVGVVGAITPWNYPFFLASNKLAPALAAGCTIVLKPSEKTPLSALIMIALCHEAGVPEGVVNAVLGFGPPTGAVLSSHPDVDLISFTGSTLVGKHIQKSAGETNAKRVMLEMGGKSPIIIGKGADLDTAVKMAQEAVYVNMGQCCCAATRTFVHESMYDEFVKRSAEAAKTRVVGCPFDKATVHGPQIDDIQFKKILNYIKIGQEEGAKLVTGGKRVGTKGYFVEPTIFADVKDNMTIAKEEIFGPVQSIFKYSTLEEVIERSNDTTYGLGAGIVSNDLDEVNILSQGIRAGSIWVNTYLSGLPQAPFGGFKMSGQGREFGEDGLKDYLEIKTVVIAVSTKNS